MIIPPILVVPSFPSLLMNNILFQPVLSLSMHPGGSSQAVLRASGWSGNSTIHDAMNSVVDESGLGLRGWGIMAGVVAVALMIFCPMLVFQWVVLPIFKLIGFVASGPVLGECIHLNTFLFAGAREHMPWSLDER